MHSTSESRAPRSDDRALQPGVTVGGHAALRAFSAAAISVVVLCLLLRSAWLCDDAFISLRVSDNLAHGYGLRWNPDERVQVFTNPLWTLLLSLPLLFTRDPYVVLIPLHLLCTLAVVLLVMRLARSLVLGVACVAALVLSKAFIDFSTSGLENSLSHASIVAFVFIRFRTQDDRRGLILSSLAASTVCLGRLDLALLIGPLWVSKLISVSKKGFLPSRTVFVSALVGGAPILAWGAFAFTYFGFLLPNTYYAKAASGFGAKFLALRGVLYLYDSLRMDPVTLATMAIACVTLIVLRRRHRWGVVAGVVLYLAYAIRVGGDFMSGRFLSAPLVFSVATFATLAPAIPRLAHAFLGFCGALSYAAHFPSLNDDYQAHVAMRNTSGFADHRRELASSTGLESFTIFNPLPSHEWANLGRALAKDPSQASVQGGVGMIGFFAGHVGHIVDIHALTDPLLARLPIPDAAHETRSRTGHLVRRIPDGYAASFPSGKNAIRSPELAAYFGDIRLVTSAPIFSPKRLLAVVRMNLGSSDHLRDAYLAEYNRKVIEPGQLLHEADPISNMFYSYWAPCAEKGVAFTSTGADLRLGRPLHALSIRFQSGEFELALMTDRDVVSRRHVSGHETESTRIESDIPFDRILIDPTSTSSVPSVLSSVDHLE